MCFAEKKKQKTKHETQLTSWWGGVGEGEAGIADQTNKFQPYLHAPLQHTQKKHNFCFKMREREGGDYKKNTKYAKKAEEEEGGRKKIFFFRFIMRT